MSKHLVIGASGLVGGHLMDALVATGHEAVGTYYKHPVPNMHQLDICNYTDVISFVAWARPAVAYLPAALSSVEYCESYPYEAHQVNVMGAFNVIKSVLDVGAKLIYFSSDYVFDGRDGPYREEDATNPVCIYGLHKLAAEHLVMSYLVDYLIVRTTVVYGWELQGKNFICWLVRMLKDGQGINVPMDQIGSPTYAPNLARAVVQLATSAAQHIYHVAGPERVDRYNFALEAAKVFGLDGDLIKPVTTSELGQTAVRPLDAGMVVTKAEASLPFPLLGYREGLKEMRGEWI